MRKKISLTSAALFFITLANNSQAASNAQLTVTANIVAATCDISLSTNNLDLGNYSAAQFTGVATPITASQRTFTVGLNNCQAPTATGDKAYLVVSGQTIGGNPNIFNSTSTNTGIMLSRVATPTAFISNGEKLLVATAGEKPNVSDLNTKALRLQAGLATTTTTGIDIGAISAPILFAFAYN